MEVTRGKAIFPENIEKIEMNAFSQRFDLIEADIPEGIKSLKKGLLLAADYSLITKNLGENRGLCLCRLPAAYSHHYPK